MKSKSIIETKTNFLCPICRENLLSRREETDLTSHLECEQHGRLRDIQREKSWQIRRLR